MAVGVVAEDAASEPDGVRRAEVVGKRFFVVHARHVRIALLHFAQQAFFGGEDGAGAVDVDGAAFEDDALAERSLGTDFSSAGAAFAIRLPIFSSCRQFEYLAQALKRN